MIPITHPFRKVREKDGAPGVQSSANDTCGYSAWWAVGIAVFAIVAHVPLTMLSHHYLPKVEDYFASYSQDKLLKRIAKLQNRLDQLNDPKYFEDLEWSFREQAFLIMYFLALGLFVQAGALFLGIGAVHRGNWFWDPEAVHAHNRLPEMTVVSFLVCVMLAGRNIYRSLSLRPSKRPKLRSDIQAQIDALIKKLDEFDGPKV